MNFYFGHTKSANMTTTTNEQIEYDYAPFASSYI